MAVLVRGEAGAGRRARALRRRRPRLVPRSSSVRGSRGRAARSSSWPVRPPADDGRDASRLLASVSLAVQRALGVHAEPLLVEPDAQALVDAAGTRASSSSASPTAGGGDGVGQARTALATSPHHRRSSSGAGSGRAGWRPGPRRGSPGRSPGEPSGPGQAAALAQVGSRLDGGGAAERCRRRSARRREPCGRSHRAHLPGTSGYDLARRDFAHCLAVPVEPDRPPGASSAAARVLAQTEPTVGDVAVDVLERGQEGLLPRRCSRSPRTGWRSRRDGGKRPCGTSARYSRSTSSGPAGSQEAADDAVRASGRCLERRDRPRRLGAQRTSCRAGSSSAAEITQEPRGSSKLVRNARRRPAFAPARGLRRRDRDAERPGSTRHDLAAERAELGDEPGRRLPARG